MMRICEICQKEFHKLGVHKANAHVNLALECSICGKEGFKNTKGLGAHKAAIHNEQTRARILSGLETGRQEVVCKICGEKCKIARSLKVHMIMQHESAEVKEKFQEQKRQEQLKKMADPELKARMLSGLLVEDRSSFYSEERRLKAAENLSKLRKEHPEWKMIGPNAYSEKMKLLFPRESGDYPFEWNQDLKKQIRDRDNWACQDCGKTQNELRKSHRRLAIHHIDTNKDNLAFENLVTLCFPCHMSRHHEIRNNISFY